MVITQVHTTPNQKISIDAKGSVSGLEYKPGKGVDFKSLGRADVTRATDIQWDAEKEAWEVVYQIGDRAGKCMTYNDLRRANVNYEGPVDREGKALFSQYDIAVEAEIAVITNLRLYAE